MAGKQAKVLSQRQVESLITYCEATRYPARNRVIVLLSFKAGLRAAEIANLTWNMVLDCNGDVSSAIELRDHAAKNGRGRCIPLHPDLRDALRVLQPPGANIGPVIVSERGSKISAGSVVNWFAVSYRQLEMHGCSSHSGRRTFITRAARLIHRAGGSLRDIQLLAGHASIEMTQRYIDGDSSAQRKLVSMV
jgi:integrase/recombinase XerD